jgi:hypothetical protein
MVRTSTKLSHSVCEEVAAPALRGAVNNPVAAATTHSLQMHALDTPCHPDTRAGCCKHVQYK